MKLLNNHVMIKPIVEDEKTETGLYIPVPRSKDEKYHHGVVVAVAEVVEEDENQCLVKEKDLVIYDQYASAPYLMEKERYIIAKITSLVGVID